MINKAQQAKADKTLDTLVRYDEGVMTRRDWIKMQVDKGATVKMRMESKTVWNRRRFNAMNWEQQQAYEKRMETKVPCFSLHIEEGSYYDITKTEYDYFNSLLKEQDGEDNMATEDNTGLSFGNAKYY